MCARIFNGRNKAYMRGTTSFIINIDVSVHEDTTYVIEIGIMHDRETASCGISLIEKCSERTCNKRKIKDEMIYP